MIHIASYMPMVTIVVIVAAVAWVKCMLRGEEFNLSTVAIVAVVAVVLMLASHHSTNFTADGKDADWDAAVQRSQDSGLPTVVLFTASWCPSCQALHGDVLARADVQDELQRHYNFYTVDLTNPDSTVRAHARAMGVSGIPLLIRYDSNRKETDRTHGMDPKEMIDWLKAGE